MDVSRPRVGFCVAAAACAVAGGMGSTLAHAASWHLVSSFGRRGVAGLPVRERRQEPPNQGAPSPPERYRSLLVSGPRGSVFVGGYARSRPGAFLVAQISASGTLVKSFGDGGVMTVPVLHWFNQDPPRMLALPGGSLLIVGLDRADQLVVVRLGSHGKPDRGFGHDGVAQYTLGHVRRFTIVTAATVEPDGDILAVYQKELPQPLNQPRVPEGQGNGAVQYVRLLASGALDRSFGTGGFLESTGPKVELLEGESGTVGACAETLAANGTLLVAYEDFALEELSPAGAVVTSFGDEPTSQLGGSASTFATKNGFHFCHGLFALSGGSVEGISGLESGTSAAEVKRLTPAGTPEAAFGAAGSTRIDVSAEASAVAPDGETFAAGASGRALVLSGVLPNGDPDPALGGAGGRRFAVALPRAAGSVPGDEEKPTWELLAGAGSLTIRVGEEIVHLDDA
jgi:hypothetical protein